MIAPTRGRTKSESTAKRIPSTAHPTATVHDHLLPVHNPYARTKAINAKTTSPPPTTPDLKPNNRAYLASNPNPWRASRTPIITWNADSNVTPNGFSVFVR